MTEHEELIELRAALEQMAREIERLKDEAVINETAFLAVRANRDDADARIAELEQDVERLKTNALALSRKVTQEQIRIAELEAQLHNAHKGHAKTLSTLGDRTIRLGEVEVERDQLKELSSQYLGWLKEIETERDAIKAATIERCAALAADRAETFHSEDRRMAARDIRDDIRALAKPPEKEEK
jgi:chromosome segregation ATPase